MESLNETIINRLKEEESLMREVLRNIHDFSDESKHAFFKEARKEYFKVLRMVNFKREFAVFFYYESVLSENDFVSCLLIFFQLSHNYGVDCTEHICLCFMLADMFLYKSDVSDNSKKKKKYPLAIFFVAHKMLKTTFPCSHELCEVVKMYRLPYFTGDKKTTRKKSVIHAEQKLLESLDFHLHILTPWALLTEVVSLAPESWKKTFMRAIKIAMGKCLRIVFVYFGDCLFFLKSFTDLQRLL